ncbi:hypothetical protein H9P43_002231 [Blastocladiella emersonii ATCC 22665]|nr:hypothetical protein H9P43_002231 [Blastocladiella emersonii ATCC 22665]
MTIPAASTDAYAFDAQVAKRCDFANGVELGNDAFPAKFRVLSGETTLGFVKLLGDGTAETTVAAPSGFSSADVVVRKGTWSIVKKRVLPQGVLCGDPYIAFRSVPPTEGEIAQPQVFTVTECTEDYPSSQLMVKEVLASGDGARWLPQNVTELNRC